MKETTGTPDDIEFLQKLSFIDGLIENVTLEGKIVWRNILRLNVKPKPKWMPMFIYRFMIKTILVQTIEKKL